MIRIAIECSRSPQELLPSAAVADYGERMDDINSLVMDICEALAAAAAVEFVVSGDSDEEWAVDVDTDLSTVIPQIPEVFKAMRSSSDAHIQFFEQGIERELCFHCGGDWVTVESRDLR